jgi:methyltransferase-like protein/ubiquinone/menaquinone biosynthesis C-methylase UbiE
MPEAGAQSYDATPYPGLSYAQTHPDRLAMLAMLLGLEPAPVERCRVLELGCGTGGNLLPMAYSLPEAAFVGVDYSARQIEVCRKQAAAIGLDNVEFVDADIAALPPDLGEFDYIVAHGLYSWVPAPVRDALLAACRRHLAPHGVAYVSYNTYPGWHSLEGIRDLMLYRTRGLDDPAERVAEARSIVTFLADSLAEDRSAYSAFVRAYAEEVMPKLVDEPAAADALLLHDELEAVNQPVYFHEFAAHVARHGLRYLCEAQLSSVMPERLPPGAAERLQAIARDAIDVEQYMDYLKNRTFRQTLLCHDERPASRGIDVEAVRRMHASSRARPVSDSPDLAGATTEEFVGLDDASFKTNHPLTKAAFAELHRRSPSALAFDELVEVAAAALGRNDVGDLAPHASELAANLVRAHAYSDSLIGLHAYRPRFALEPPERPLASASARAQAAAGSSVITNLRHERVTLDAGERELLLLLDGTCDRSALASALSETIAAGALDRALAFMARGALLVEVAPEAASGAGSAAR